MVYVKDRETSCEQEKKRVAEAEGMTGDPFKEITLTQLA